MPCGCSDKNINKKLDLEYMKTMSIDDIINLYKDGYTLEGLEHNREGPEITSMTYENQCSGGTELVYNHTSGPGTLGSTLITKGFAWAQRFPSTFRCLDTVQFYMKRLQNNTFNFFIEIREDLNGKPNGAPLSSTGRLKQDLYNYADISTTPDWVYESPTTILQSGRYYWICFVPTDWNDSDAYREVTNPAYQRFNIYDGDSYTPGYEEALYYNGAWHLSTEYRLVNLTSAFALYKKPTFIELCTSITNVTANPTGVTVGDSTTLSATTSPTGTSFTVEFVDQNNNVRATGTSATNGTVSVTWNTTSMTPGTYNIKARVGSQCISSTATPVIINAVACTSITNVTANPTSVTVGGSIDLSATTSPTGTSFTVEFIDQNNNVLASAASSTASGLATASWNTSVTTPGTYNIKARVGTQCTSSVATSVTVNPVTVTCLSISGVTATPGTITLGNSTTLSATVTPSSPGALTIEFIDSDTNTLLGTGTSCSTTSTNNTCSITWTPTITRTYNIKARVGTQCTSTTAASVIVNPSAATCLSISNVIASKSTTLINNPITLTATITPSVAGALTIEFVNINTNTVLGTCNTTSTNNTCSVIWIPIIAGTYNIKARSGTCVSSLATTVTATQVVEAGASGAGMILIGGLAIGALYLATMMPPSPPKEIRL